MATPYLEDCSVPVTSASTNEGVAASDAPAQHSNVSSMLNQIMLLRAVRIPLCGSETAAKHAATDSDLATPRSKLLLMRPRLTLRPVLECAAPGKADVNVVVDSMLRRASSAETNSAVSGSYAQDMQTITC